MTRIHTEVIIDIATGQVLKDSFYEYEGPIAECKGDTNIPGPSESETELTDEQKELVAQQVEQLRKQNQIIDNMWPEIQKAISGELSYEQLMIDSSKELQPLYTDLAKKGIDLNSLQIDSMSSEIQRNEALKPMILDTLGYSLDANGKYVPSDTSQDPIQNMLKEQYSGAISGEIPLTPDVEKYIKDYETSLEQRLGPNWRETTPGIQALNEINNVKQNARQSMITNTGSNYMGYTSNRLTGLLAGTGQGTGNVTVPSITSSGANTATGLLSGTSTDSTMAGISDLRNYYQNERLTNAALKAGNAAGQSSSMMGGLMGGAQAGSSYGPWGSAIGGGIGLLAGYLL